MFEDDEHVRMKHEAEAESEDDAVCRERFRAEGVAAGASGSRATGVLEEVEVGQHEERPTSASLGDATDLSAGPSIPAHAPTAPIAEATVRKVTTSPVDEFPRRRASSETAANGK